MSRHAGDIRIYAVGLSHHTAPLEVRERFVCTAEAAEQLRAEIERNGMRTVLLSTCNRTELYIAAHGGVVDAAERAKRLLAENAGYPTSTAERWLYAREGQDAVRHLFRVTAGLDSLVVGEAQIQGQVREAHEAGSRRGAKRQPTGAVLSRLFDSALLVGGRVRAETKLGVGAASVPSAAVELARKIFGSIGGRAAAVVGAGDMSELALRCFHNEGAATSVVAVRSRERAEQLGRATGARVTSLTDMASLLGETDIVVTATSAPGLVLTSDVVRGAMRHRRRGPLLIVDIAVPRDVEPAAGAIENVFLYDIDDLRSVVDGTLDRRRAEIADADQIVEEGVGDFWNWYSGRRAVPLIRALRGRAERLRQRELSRALRTLGHLPADDLAAVDELTRQLLAKLLHAPTQRLRDAAVEGDEATVARVARYLFDLDETDEQDAPATNGKDRSAR